MNILKTPLYFRIKQYLYGLILEKDGADNSLPSENALAALFNVSRITTKRALNELEQEGLVIRKAGLGTFVKENIDRERLEQLLHKSSSEPSFSGSPTANKSVVLILPDLKSKYYMHLASGLFDSLREKNVNLVLALSHFSQEEESYLLKKYATLSYGIIIHPIDSQNYNKDIIRFALRNFPLVLIDNVLTGINATIVTSDNFSAGYNATSYLLNRGKKNIAIICQPFKNNFTLTQRLNGYLKAISETNSLSPLVLDTLTNYDENANKKLSSFFQEYPSIDSIIALNYETGIKAISFLQSSQYLPNSDDVVIFDEEFADIYNLLNYNINYIRQDPYKIGILAGKSICQQLTDKAYLHKVYKIPTTLYTQNKPFNF